MQECHQSENRDTSKISSINEVEINFEFSIRGPNDNKSL